jgi:YfiH family protein
MLASSLLAEHSTVRHAFFTREGGVSEGIFASLNCGIGSGDDPASVSENRRRAMERLCLSGGVLTTLYQVHSAEVVTAAHWPTSGRPKADAMVTRERGLALGILTADCLPVLLADPRAGVIGAAHAGWKGALSGVLENVVEAMISIGSKRKDIRAGIGPAIEQASYEVGPEFSAPFLEQDSENARFFIPSERSGHQRFDLKGYAARRLKAAGIEEIDTLPSDTYAEPEMFFSYRRACHRRETDYGRLLSAISLEP